MNKKDLKEGQEVYVKGQVIHTGDHLDIVLAKGSFIGNAIILHHEKPVVPQFVAEIIEYYKRNNATLYDALREKNFNKQYSEWLLNEQNAYDKVAKAWLDGYEVEKEKRYTVKITKTKQYLYSRDNDFSFISYVRPDDNPHNCHTRKELEEANFGWVFDCPGIEIEEAE